MSNTNPCLSCWHAKWNTTKTGRLHPDGDGRCQWTYPEIHLPKAFYFFSTGSPKPSGGFISRKADDTSPCATWEPRA